MDKTNQFQTGVTHVKVQEIGTYVWRITNFRLGISLRKMLSSPLFTISDKADEITSQIQNLKVDVDENGDEYCYILLSLTLIRDIGLLDIYATSTTEQSHRNYCVSIALIDKTGIVDMSTMIIHPFPCYLNEECTSSLSNIKFVKKDYIFHKQNDLLRNGTLFIQFKMYSDDGTVDSYPHLMRIKPPPKTYKRSSDFEQLLENESFGDIKLIVSNKEINVYRGILAARSPVFAAMFDHDMKEKAESKIEIPDINYEVMKECLRFMYAGKVNNLKEIASDLLVAADKYALDELKSNCEEMLIDNLNVENICDILILADCHKADALKSAAIDFFMVYAKDIVDSEKFKSDMKSAPALMLEMLDALANKLN